MSLEDKEDEIETMGLETNAGMVSGEGSPIYPSKSQSTTSPNDFGKIRVATLAHRFVGNDPINSFAKNYDKTVGDWIALFGKTMLPSGIASSDLCVVAAFRALDSVICRQGTYLLRRLTYIQLIQLFVSLETIIKSDRENGQIYRKPRYRDATVAIDIYINAQERRSNIGDLRHELKERKRCGKRWGYLTRHSPLFVLTYSDTANPIVYTTSTFYEFLHHTKYRKKRTSERRIPQF